MHYRVISSILGIFLLILSFFLLIFYFVALFIYPEEAQAYSFLLSFIITLTVGLVLFLSVGKFSEDDVTFREGFVVVGIGWIVITLFGALPFYISNDIPSFTDAYFESMSGFTTTGASILTNIEALGKTVLLWRSFTHWLGGMGFIVLSLAILPALGVGGMQLYIAEVPGPNPEKLVPRVGQTARILYMVYIVLTVAQVAALYLAGMNMFESLCHTFGSMGTGGFSPLNNSVGQYKANGISAAFSFELIIIIFMFIAGSNFALHYRAFKGNWRVYFQDPEFKFYVFIIVFSFLSIALDLFKNSVYNTWQECLRHSSFTVVSIITTTGYSTEDFDVWPVASKFFLVFLMFIGATAGSTGGGIKVLRIMTLIRQALVELKHVIHPKRVYVIRFGQMYISREVLASMNMFVLLYIIFYVAAVLILSATGFDMATIATMVVACFSNVGPGFSMVGPAHNYGFLPDYAKWILSYMMVLGRLEILPIIVLSLPGTWTK
ncbi:MAG: TrkH family potassium uptake protein [Spirochaetia bacterium]|nr:TrkH family potassium uptake protein [Spirochaetia bacterium]